MYVDEFDVWKLTRLIALTWSAYRYNEVLVFNWQTPPLEGVDKKTEGAHLSHEIDNI